ncbi:MAG: fluoride efflux transporter FluC [Acidimicrobiia bacterium]
MTLLAASIAGAAGAVCRYLISGWVHEGFQSDLPIGTLTVNLTGSLGLGLIVGAGPLDSVLTLTAIGFLGGFTTFSTWMIETIRLGPRSPRALLNLLLSLTGGVTAAIIGFTLTN